MEHNEYPLSLVVIPHEDIKFRFSYSRPPFSEEIILLFAKQLGITLLHIVIF